MVFSDVIVVRAMVPLSEMERRGKSLSDGAEISFGLNLLNDGRLLPQAIAQFARLKQRGCSSVVCY